MQIYQSQNVVDTDAIGAELFKQFVLPSCVYLTGDMGVGKTSLCQAIIRAAGYTGAVTSPTYNLIQEYAVNAGTIYHMDLYRIEDPAELEYLGLEDLWQERSLFLIEWPSRGGGYLHKADHTISIEFANSGKISRGDNKGRVITLDSTEAALDSLRPPKV